MINKLKGGIETVIAVVLLIAIVIALMVAVVMPNFRATQELGDAAEDKLDSIWDE